MPKMKDKRVKFGSFRCKTETAWFEFLDEDSKDCVLDFGNSFNDTLQL